MAHAPLLIYCEILGLKSPTGDEVEGYLAAAVRQAHLIIHR
jgi:hypothetical protein